MTARGALELIWEGCYEAGDDYLGTAHDIESTVGWTGESGALVRALVRCGYPEGGGFIDHVSGDGDETTYRVHEFHEHAPAWVKVKLYKRRWRALGLGDPTRWVAARVRILRRDGYQCAYCGQPADTVDHIVPRVKGGSHDDSNLAAACRRCNGLKQDRTPEQAGLTLGVARA